MSAPFTISRAEAESWLRAAALGLDDMAMLAIKIGNAATFAAVGSVIEILDFSRRLITWPREARPDAHERRVRGGDHAVEPVTFRDQLPDRFDRALPLDEAERLPHVDEHLVGRDDGRVARSRRFLFAV